MFFPFFQKVNGEIWVFDKKFTQYIPLSLFDIQNYTNGPAIFIFDCSGAGRTAYWYQRFIELREENRENMAEGLKGFFFSFSVFFFSFFFFT